VIPLLCSKKKPINPEVWTIAGYYMDANNDIIVTGKEFSNVPSDTYLGQYVNENSNPDKTPSHLFMHNPFLDAEAAEEKEFIGALYVPVRNMERNEEVVSYYGSHFVRDYTVTGWPKNMDDNFTTAYDIIDLWVEQLTESVDVD